MERNQRQTARNTASVRSSPPVPMERVRNSFRQIARADERVLKLGDMLKGGFYSINFEAHYDEIKRMHASRIMRHLRRKDLERDFFAQYSDVILQVQAYRSRIVEMKMDCFYKLGELETHVKALSNHLHVQYASALKSYKTITDKKMAVNEVLNHATGLADKMNNFIKYADLVIDDLDKNGWVLKNIIDAIQLNKEKGYEV